VKLILVKQYQLNLRRNKLKFSVKVTLKKDVLDPQGKVVQQTLQNMGMDTLKTLRQGKYFEIDINENDEQKASDKIEEMCKKLLVNLIIEDFKVSKV
jgi:phosphoribosylformylglycinamidine synthase PurS subunit